MKRIAALLAALLCLSGCSGSGNVCSTDFFAMDTFMSIAVCGEGAEDSEAAQELATELEQRVNVLEPALSRTREDSDLYRLNHAEGAVCTVAEDTYAAIADAVEYAKLTGGAFDPTMAALTDLWGINTEDARVPYQNEIEQALSGVGYENIELLGDGRVRLLNGAQLDLGGIGKGFATDEVQAAWEQRDRSGTWSVLARLGGNVGAFGENPDRDGGNWVVGIADPDNSADYLATVAVKDLSVVTSGDYERYFEQDGKRYHHIFDPATGYPAESGLRSVTVIDESSTRADALTTALFVMGLEEGMMFCAENQIAAVFITADRQVYTTQQVGELCTFSFLGEEKGYTYAQ